MVGLPQEEVVLQRVGVLYRMVEVAHEDQTRVEDCNMQVYRDFTNTCDLCHLTKVSRVFL